MNRSNPHVTIASQRRTIQIFFALLLLEDLGVMTWLLAIPSDPKNTLFLGFSAERVLMIVPVLLVGLGLLWINRDLRCRADWTERLIGRLAAMANRDGIYLPILWLSGALAIGVAYGLWIGSRLTDLYLRAYFLRVAPFLLWAGFICFQTLISLRSLRFGGDLRIFRTQKGIILAVGVGVGVLILLGAGITWTKIGLTPDQLGWGDPGVPILPGQVFLAGLVAAVGGLLIIRFKRLPANLILDGLICILLWVVAAWTWQAEPQRPSFFAPYPRPPNYEYYPFSDAVGFDTAAQSLLIGNGLGMLVTRPLYSFFLALAQAASGIGYASMITWQVPILAIIPPMLYLLGKSLYHRLAGGLIAILAIFHESNAIALLGIINVSNSKLIMSDLPTTAGVILFTLLVVEWLKKNGARNVFGLAAGGVLGLTMLIRLQVVILLPGALLLSWLILRRQPILWLKQALLLLAGLILVIAPWLWRNWQRTGELTFSEVSRPSQIGLLGQRYSQALGDRTRLPGETDDMYAGRMMRTAARFTLEHPLEVAGFMTGHFIHNQIATLLVLPDAFPLAENLKTFAGSISQGNAKPGRIWQDCCGLEAYVKALPYWDHWNGALERISLLPLLLSLLLIGIGTGATWGQQRLIGLVPWLVNLNYSLGNALLRTSGWRFNLPVDWTGYFYYAIGLVQVGFWVAMFFRNRQILAVATTQPAPLEKTSILTGQRLWAQAILLGLLFFSFSAAIPLAERLIPQRYSTADLPMILANLESQEAQAGPGRQISIQDFLKQPGAVALLGRALYPRYYLAGQGEPSDDLSAFAPQDYARLGFILLGERYISVILPAGVQPDYFPHAADVLVIGCARQGFVEAGWVAILGQGIPQKVLQQDDSTWTGTCPEPDEQ